MSEDNSLQLPNREKLKWFDVESKYFLNKMTLIYGKTESGKSTIIHDIMYSCREYIPIVTVFAPTNDSNNAYTEKIPFALIHKEPTIELLQNIMDRQKTVSNIYKISNNMELLKQLFDKVASENVIRLEMDIIDRAEKSIRSIEMSDQNKPTKKKSKEKIKKTSENCLKKLYKQTIHTNRIKLETEYELSKNEKSVIKFLYINPNFMLILDDCGNIFKTFCKKNPELMKDIFYNGRHNHFTTIISAQDDKEIESEFRKNAHVSIFTTEQITNANFTRSSNNFSKQEKNKSALVANAVFKQDANEDKHFRKLVYIQSENDPFYYMEATLREDFQMCDPHIWKYIENLPKKVDNLCNNTLIDAYIDS